MSEDREKALEIIAKKDDVIKSMRDHIFNLKHPAPKNIFNIRNPDRLYNFIAWCKDTFSDRPTKDAAMIMRKIRHSRLEDL